MSVGGGSKGNVAAGAITQLLGVVPGIEAVFNPRAAEGGADGEAPSARARPRPAHDPPSRSRDGAGRLRDARGRGVAGGEDGARHPRPQRLPGRRWRAGSPCSSCRAASMRSPIRPSACASRCASTSRRVRPPISRRCTASTSRARTTCRSASRRASRRSIRARPAWWRQSVRDALERFLHPVFGGPNGTGWDLGRDVFMSDVAAELERTPGVDYIEALDLVDRRRAAGRIGARGRRRGRRRRADRAAHRRIGSLNTMSIALPNLDDRRWSDLVEQGRALIPLYAPEWTDHNASDPGITLMELLACGGRDGHLPAQPAHRRAEAAPARTDGHPPRAAAARDAGVRSCARARVRRRCTLPAGSEFAGPASRFDARCCCARPVRSTWSAPACAPCSARTRPASRTSRPHGRGRKPSPPSATIRRSARSSTWASTSRCRSGGWSQLFACIDGARRARPNARASSRERARQRAARASQRAHRVGVLRRRRRCRRLAAARRGRRHARVQPRRHAAPAARRGDEARDARAHRAAAMLGALPSAIDGAFDAAPRASAPDAERRRAAAVGARDGPRGRSRPAPWSRAA